jgi:microcin C transport system permease protein
MIPTLFGIMLVNFVVVQFAPGGPVEQVIAELTAVGGSPPTGSRAAARTPAGGGAGQQAAAWRPTASIAARRGSTPNSSPISSGSSASTSRRSSASADAVELSALRFRRELFPLGLVVELIIDKMPVSISLGLWTTLLAYTVSIPLGVAKAVRDGSRFDVWSSAVVIIGYAIPGFLFAILLRTLFAEGSEFFPLFPLRGLTSSNFEELSTLGQVRTISTTSRCRSSPCRSRASRC